MSQTTMDADLRSIQQARDLAVGAREAMRSFQFASQQQVDKICEAMVAAAVREAERLGQLAHDETGFGYAAQVLHHHRRRARSHEGMAGDLETDEEIRGHDFERIAACLIQSKNTLKP